MLIAALVISIVALVIAVISLLGLTLPVFGKKKEEKK